MKRRCAVAIVLALAGHPARAVDFSFSGFGTFGYAVSNQPYTYQRFIDDGGTFKRDSVAGAQADVRFDAQWSATLQVKAAPSTSSDGPYKASASWAFVSYRPNNDWLVRVGKQRVPLYLNSENYDVGVTYDFARLPTEMYSVLTSNDAVGVSFSRTWKWRDGDVSLDGAWGQATNDERYWKRDTIAGVQSSGPAFFPLDYKGGGLVLTYRGEDQTFRIGYFRALFSTDADTQIQVLSTYPFVALAPSMGYFQTSAALPGPGLIGVHRLGSKTLTLGVDLALPADFRVVSEFARTLQPESDLAPQGNRGYLAVLKRLGHWTPYASCSFLRSTPHSLDFYDAVNGQRVPAAVPGASALNAAQRAGADAVFAYDQRSLAVGASYSFSATSKVKVEAMRTRVGRVSSFIDAPDGGESGHRRIDVFSLSYSVVF